MRHFRLKCSHRPLVAVAALSLTSVIEAATSGLLELVQDAELIAAVKVLSTDDTAMPADGPMYVDATVLKVVKGNLWRQKIRFGASAWVGPTYRSGEERIVFLNPVVRGHAYYFNARWSSLEAGKVDVFFVNEALDNCSEASLIEFLRKTEAIGQAPPKVESKPVHPGTGHRVLISLVNDGSQTLWLNLLRLMISVEANQVRYALPVTWRQTGRGGWVSLPPGETLAGGASVEQLDGAKEMTIVLSHRSARFPHPSWVGSRSIKVTIRD